MIKTTTRANDTSKNLLMGRKIACSRQFCLFLFCGVRPKPKVAQKNNFKSFYSDIADDPKSESYSENDGWEFVSLGDQVSVDLFRNNGHSWRVSMLRQPDSSVDSTSLLPGLKRVSREVIQVGTCLVFVAI